CASYHVFYAFFSPSCLLTRCQFLDLFVFLLILLWSCCCCASSTHLHILHRVVTYVLEFETRRNLDKLMQLLPWHHHCWKP
ncbi:hypothetical protein M758_3G113900, partial [Ceratodon purpureus]